MVQNWENLNRMWYIYRVLVKGMQKRQKIMVIGFLFIALIAALPGQVSADSDFDDDDECISIVVITAEYLDYDNDGYEDDIITIFKVIPPDDDWEKGRIDIDCCVEKPSGKSISAEFSVYTRNGVEITIVWFDWADEPGDYILVIKAEASDYDDDDEVGPGYIAHVFDPPGGSDPGPPVIAIMSIDELK